MSGYLQSTYSHLHISVSDENCNVYGGHLEEGSLVKKGADVCLFSFDKNIEYLSNNYFGDILSHMDKEDIILSSCKTLNKKNVKPKRILYYKKLYNFICKNNLKFYTQARRQGWLMTLNLKEYKKLSYQIPNYIKIWYGDDWIWSQIIKNNKKYVIYKNRYALHLRNKTLMKKEIQSVLNKDKEMMNENGKKWIEKNIYKKTKLFNRYV